MALQSNGKGSYLMQVKFVGGEKTEIIVDSGAEEHVCPWEWGNSSRWRMLTLGCILGMLVEGPSHTMGGGMF